MGYLESLFNLQNKVVVITGGGGLLCSEMAKGFAQAGCKVFVLDVRLEKAQLVVEEIKRLGGNAWAFELNVCRKSEFERALSFVTDLAGRVDILVNGAGVNSPAPFLEVSEESWDEIQATNLKGTLFGCQVFGRSMLAQSSGSIINISSASAGPPLSKAFAYSVAKAGVKNLTQNIAREWGQKGVRVNAIRPGFFPTEWSRKNFITKEREAAILGHTPMGRYGEAQELIGVVLWLGSDASGFVTGSEICVDGGFTAMTI